MFCDLSFSGLGNRSRTLARQTTRTALLLLSLVLLLPPGLPAQPGAPFDYRCPTGEVEVILDERGRADVRELALTVHDTIPYSGAIVSYTFPAGVQRATIRAVGASGGSPTTRSSFGADISADFLLREPTLQLLVGQRGRREGPAAWGGGGTFVAYGTTGAADFVPENTLLIAGGGGVAPRASLTSATPRFNWIPCPDRPARART